MKVWPNLVRVDDEPDDDLHQHGKVEVTVYAFLLGAQLSADGKGINIIL